MFDSDKILNFRRRAANLTPDSPYPSLFALLDCLIGIVRAESLETGVVETQEQRDTRRIAINAAKETLMNLLIDPEAEYRRWVEERRRDEQN